MESFSINGVDIYFDPEDQQVAELLRPAVSRTLQVLREHYSILPPDDCRLYVMRSWQPMFFHAATWPWRIYLTVSYPYLALRARRIWAVAGGWAFPLGKRQVVGVKPPDLLQTAAGTGLGERIFTSTADANEKLIRVTAHELTHASTGVIRPHTWLHEGLAMRVVDHVAGGPTVQAQTIDALALPGRSVEARRTRRLNMSDPDSLIYTYVRGYWLTRYLEETQLDLLKNLLTFRRTRRQLEYEVAHALGFEPSQLWQQFDEVAVQHFIPH